MGILTRHEILSADDLPREEVAVPEWGGSVWVRTMTGAERDRFEADYAAMKTDNIRARLAVVTCTDEWGTRLFEPDDANTLGLKSAGALARIFDVATRLNRLTKADVDELEKNS